MESFPACLSLRLSPQLPLFCPSHMPLPSRPVTLDTIVPSTAGVAEHSVDMVAAADGAAARRHGGQAEVAMAERRLNCFVRCVALIERLGNALGTLAFTWATVVLLGGFATKLRHGNDFWFATTIFFLEAFRMFSRNNRTDYQLFFGTRGALKSLGWNWSIVLAYFNGVIDILHSQRRTDWLPTPYHALPLLGILVAVGQFVCPGARRLLARFPLTLRRAISLWSPVVAIIILLTPSIYQYSLLSKQQDHESYFKFKNYTVEAICIVYGLLLVVVLLVTVSRMRFTGNIIKPKLNIILDRKQEFRRRIVLNLCMIGANVTSAFSFSRTLNWYWPLIMIAVEALTIVLASFGNFQIPAAVLRVVLPLVRFESISSDYKNNCKEDDATPSPACDPDNINFAPSLYIFYGMVLVQGALYLVACMVEIFSFIPRRFLINNGGFKGQWGVDSVDLYYTYALEKCMERNILAPNISLCIFAIDYLNYSTKRQLHGIRTAHILLQRDPTRKWLLVKLKASTETMTRLVRMLHQTGQENETIIRLFAAKVIDQVAKSLLVVNSPGIVQNVSLLLDYGSQWKRRNPLLDTDDEREQNDYLLQNTTGNPMERGDDVPNSGKLLETQECSTQQIGSNEHNSWIARRWRQVSEFWSVPQEEPLTEQDLLPVIGMSIIESLATYDESNCTEIRKSTDIIRKITRFTSFNISDTTYNDIEKKALVLSSLKLFYRLTSIDGEIGITLRNKISNHPFLLRNLSEVLGDITSNYEMKRLAAGIIRNLAIDASIRLAIGRVRRIITRLMHAFLTPDELSSSAGASVSHSREALRKVAGQALAMLAIGNVDNCLTMLRQTGYSFIEELTNMIHFERYRCVAASLLRSVCMHARLELKDTDLKQLSYISRMVLERILYAEGEELEIFIALSSHIYEAIPEEFAGDFEYGQIKVTFVKRLVEALNANMEPDAHCPGIRRVILEQALKLMEYDSSNVNCFRNLRMIEVLSMVEETISEAENYTIFMGDVGLMEASEPLSSLVARAKQLLDVR